MGQRVIQEADLTWIANNLQAVNQSISTLDQSVNVVNNNVKIVNDDLSKLKQEFDEYVHKQQRANRLNTAETRLVKYRQEIEQKFGHYDVVRRTSIGILQADDLEIVKKDTITNASEEIMISTPGYWLAPCLVALSAWINDSQELAERALKEAIKRDDEKTSLFFALVCRRANRKPSCFKWIDRYLENQDADSIDRKTIVVLDAYASGLFGTDTEGLVTKQVQKWLDNLEEKPNFTQQQRQQWMDAILLKRKPIKLEDYPYLRKYSHTWPVLEDIMEGAHLHAEMFGYLQGVFNQPPNTQAIKKQIDDILMNLVESFDDEEIPLRKKETFEQFVVDFAGDESRAKKQMKIEEKSFETHKDFSQLLTDAAMMPESSHASASIQKFAFALSRNWVLDAYNDVVVQNRMKIPNEIEVNVDTFNDKTYNGENENEMLQRFSVHIDNELAAALAPYVLTQFHKFCLYGGGFLIPLGLVMMLADNTFLGILSMVGGAGLLFKYNSDKKQIELTRQQITDQYAKKRTEGISIIRAILAEVVDFRRAFDEKDAESSNVIDFLENLSPEQYIRKLVESNRRIRL